MNSDNRLCFLFLFTFFLMAFFGINTGYSQNSVFEWVHQAGGQSNERGTAIELDSFGNIYCCGEVTDTTQFADTSFVANFADVFISKFTSDGDLQWVKLCGGTGLDRGLDLKVDNNNDILITGFFSNIATFGDSTLTSSGFTDVFVAKYNSQGNFQWVVHGAGSSRDKGLCIATDSNNNIYVSGFFESSFHLGNFILSAGSYSTFFIAKISPAGSVLWAKQAIMQDFGESFTNDIICDNNGDVIFTGYFNDTMVFPDTTLYSYDGNDDIFVAKYNTNGDNLWVMQAGGNYDDAGNAITIDEFDNIYLAGEFAHTATFGDSSLTSTDNNADLFWGKLDSNGNFQWVNHGSGAQRDVPLSIFYNQQNGIAICGGYSSDFTIGDSTFNSGATADIFLATFTSAGVFKNALSIGDNGEDVAIDVVLTNNNNALMIGQFSQLIYFGDSLLVSHNLADIFITKINLNLLSGIANNHYEFISDDFSLSQNYPNPFNPTTTIKFYLPKQSYVELKMFDVLGKEIKTLISDYKTAGKYKYVLDGNNLASGLYFIKMEAGHFHALKKMLLVK